MRIERKYLAHYIRCMDDTYERLGADLEEFTPEISANVEKFSNILGEKRVIISDYEKTANVEQFYADPGSSLYVFLQSLIDNNAVMDETKTQVVDVKLWEQHSEDYYAAIAEEVFVEVTSYGGDYNGYRIGFKLHYTGKKIEGLFCIGDQTFTEGRA